jgi:ABC-type sugar transport system permease subunit
MKIDKRALAPWAFLALPLAMYATWVIVPVVESFAFAFTKGDTIATAPVWVGFANFARAMGDPEFLRALSNNAIWLVAFVALPIPIGLAVAMLFNGAFKGAKAFKTLFYLPMTLSFAIIGTIWMWIYNPNFGVLNQALRAVGLGSWAMPWLGDERFMTGALVAVGVWRQVPYVMILYLAGLQGVPTELLEAATVDGASKWQRFRHVTLPMLAPATLVAMTISIIDSLRTFDVIYVMTNTKARAAETLSTYMYSNAFGYSNYGYGSAISVIQFLITLGFILVYVNRALKAEEDR